MDMTELCTMIDLPAEVTEQVCAAPGVPEEILRLLRTPGRWEEGRKALAAFLGRDEDGFLTLAGHLQCALETWVLYRERGLSAEVFADTMKCFSRFVREHRDSYGRYGFDRDFWTPRQLSAVLFRIGEMEYELREEAIHLHIPSDAVLDRSRLRQSWEAARAMLGDAPMVCHSWLLSPDLPGLLDGDSRILAFQREFHIHTPGQDREFRQWVFKDPDLPDAALPEDTTLQRRLKAYLLAGNTFHDAHGTLREDPFG